MTTEVSTGHEFFIKDEHYQSLVEDIKAALVEGSFTERMARIETYHKIGEEVRRFSADMNRNVTATVQALSNDLNIAERSVWTAVKFYDTYPDINALPDGKAISWSKVKKLLGEGTEEKVLDLEKIAAGIVKRYGEQNAKKIAESILR